MSPPSFSRHLLLPLLIAGIGYVASTPGTLLVPRQDVCRALEASTVPTAPANSSAPCATLSWKDIITYSSNFTTIHDPSVNKTFVIQQATLPLLGAFSSSVPNLTYACPPDNYNGFSYAAGSFCETGTDLILTMMYVDTVTGMLWGLDIIHSGAPFPPTLVANKPPFGVTRIHFPGGVPGPSSGFFRMCDVGASGACPGLGQSRELSLQGLTYEARGNFQLGSRPTTNFPAEWFMDDARQLLALNAGPQVFLFNRSGFFFYDGQACTWASHCDFQCEVYNYDSRFLDYLGTWTVVSKRGASGPPLTLTAWGGNAIDAAGVFPIIMWVDPTTGFYVGLDKLDPLSMAPPTGGASYWYPDFKGVTPDFENFTAGTIASLGCPGSYAEWAAQPTHSLSNGTLLVPRQNVCRALEASTVPTAPANSSAPCATLSWKDIITYSSNFTTIHDPSVNKTFVIQQATLPLLGGFSSSVPNLTYACPPDNYNGFSYAAGSFCETGTDLILTMMYVDVVTGMLWGLDIIHSGAPFPPTLVANKPPFGVTRIHFPGGVPVPSSGFFRMCDVGASGACPGLGQSRELSLQGLTYEARGNFQLGSRPTTNFPAEWFMDDARQLLALNAGPQVFLFNRSGFFFYDGQACTWASHCDFQCEVYNYDSRFLDYLGTWTVVSKRGASGPPLTLTAWGGNAIDAAGVFPIIMWVDPTTGFYVGLDKLDPLSMAPPTGGASYWYPDFKGVTPDFENFSAGTIASLGCPGSYAEWAAQPPPSPSPPPYPSPGSSVKGCLEHVMDLAFEDRRLGENTLDSRLSRQDQKLATAVAVDSANDFHDVFRYLKAKGNGFSCGYTLGWVSEVFQGLRSTYPYCAAGATGDNVEPNTAAGYIEVEGDNVTKLFRHYAASPDAYLFYVYHGGLADHVYLVEQISNHRGYRIYQSYNSVYSLLAWLQPGSSVSELAALWSDDPSRGHIVPNLKLYGTMDAAVQALTAGQYNITHPPPLAVLQSILGSTTGTDVHAYLTYWSNMAVNKSAILEALSAAKTKYGGARAIAPDEFLAGYVAELAKLSAWYKEAGPPGSSGLRVPQWVFDTWTSMYGSPNSQTGPGLPFNLLQTMMQGLSPAGGAAPQQLRYFLQVLPVRVAPRSRTCTSNAQMLWRALK